MRVYDKEEIFKTYRYLSTPSHYKYLYIITEMVNENYRVEECWYDIWTYILYQLYAHVHLHVQ